MGYLTMSVLFWLLPSLTALLCWIKLGECNCYRVDSWTVRDWIIIIFFSIVYPLSLVLFIHEYMMNQLEKTDEKV